MSQLPDREDPLDRIETIDRTFLAHEGRAELTVAAEPDAAFHVALERRVDPVGRHPAVLQRPHGRERQRFRAANKRDGVSALECGVVYRGGDAANPSAVAAGRAVDCHIHVYIEATTPGVQVALVENIVGPARAVSDDDLTVLLPPVEHFVD